MTKTKSLNQYSPKLPVKPHTHSTMLITFTKGNNFNTVIVDLANIGLVYDDIYTIVTIDLPKRVFGEDRDKANFVLSISDDPTMNHAGDWTQLGCSKYRFFGDNIELLDSEKFKFKCEKFRFELLQPERRFPNDIETKFYIW